MFVKKIFKKVLTFFIHSGTLCMLEDNNLPIVDGYASLTRGGCWLNLP